MKKLFLLITAAVASVSVTSAKSICSSRFPCKKYCGDGYQKNDVGCNTCACNIPPFEKPNLPNYSSTMKQRCLQVSQFTPNACAMPIYLKHCRNHCNEPDSNKNLRCGKPTKIRHRRIVGGGPSALGKWPWHVSLRLNGTQWCSGVILSTRYVLTTAHCFDNNTSLLPSDWQVNTGDHVLDEKDDLEKTHDVLRIFSHNKFQFEEFNLTMRSLTMFVPSHDIAVLEVEPPINLKDEHRATICLPDEHNLASVNDTCRIIGWGHLQFNGSQPAVLNQATVPIVSNEVCNARDVYEGNIDESQLLCAGYDAGLIDACQFDSGGAMSCFKGLWYATGLVSSGFECARPKAYGLYTNVMTFKEWIVETILKSPV